jgi:hypothetical protein
MAGETLDNPEQVTLRIDRLDGEHLVLDGYGLASSFFLGDPSSIARRSWRCAPCDPMASADGGREWTVFSAADDGRVQSRQLDREVGDVAASKAVRTPDLSTAARPRGIR